MLPNIKKILYATDLGGEGARNALLMAAGLAQSSGAQMVVLHVIDTISSSTEGMLRNMLSDKQVSDLKKRDLEAREAELKQRLEEFHAEVCPDQPFPGGDPVRVVAQGRSDEVILEQAEKHGVDMIVMGTRTHTGIGQLLGSTANRVIHHSKVPVVVYPL